MADFQHLDRGERRVFSPHFKHMFVQVHDWLTEVSPSMRDDFLRMAEIPPRYVVRWRTEIARREASAHGPRSVRYPRAEYHGRHRAPRSHGRPNDDALLGALHTVLCHLIAMRSE